jgi:Uma2 family endonuclease
MPAVHKTPSAKKLTPDDLLRLPDQGMGFELVNGELRELNPSLLSSFVAGKVLAHLAKHVKTNSPGWVTGAGASYRCFPNDPDKVLRADTAFHRLDRLTAAQVVAEGHCTVVPDLVVEVVSPNDLADEVNDKRAEWLDAGVRLVWVVYPVRQQVHAFQAGGPVRLFGPADALTAEPVLPEFRVPVAELFRLPAVAPTS